MTHVVYKYPFDSLQVSIGGGAMEVPSGRVVHVAAQRASDGLPTVWVQHDTNGDGRMTLLIVGTGHEFDGPPEVEHVGSAVCAGGSLVWHVYRRTS